MAEKRKRRTKQEMQEFMSNTNLDILQEGSYSGIYIGKEILGFKKNKRYKFELVRPLNSVYTLKEINENLCINYTSTISIKQNWIDIKLDD